MEETEQSEVYRWLVWWTHAKLSKRRVSNVKLARKAPKPHGERRFFSQSDEELPLEIVPDFGTYSLRWKSRYVLTVTHTRSEKNDAGPYGAPHKELSITLSLWGTNDKKQLLEIVRQAKKEFGSDHKKQLYYYSLAHDGWTANSFAPRPLETIYLPSEIIERLRLDMENFLLSYSQYRDLGIPYRRGYLIEGPPGTGKTSLIQALAAHLGIPLYYVNLNSTRLSSDNLADYFRQLQSPALVLFEDVDCIPAARERSADGKPDRISTADLLNVLDGIVAGDNRIILMTTNHPDRLDPALVRAGRIDMKLHVGYPSEGDVFRFYEKASKFFQLPEWEVFKSLLPNPHTIGDAQAQAFQTGSRYKEQLNLKLEESNINDSSLI